MYMNHICVRIRMHTSVHIRTLELGHIYIKLLKINRFIPRTFLKVRKEIDWRNPSIDRKI